MFCRKNNSSRISWILWCTIFKPRSEDQDMDVCLYRLPFTPKPLLQTRARTREGNISSQKDIIHQLWPVKLRHTKPMCNDTVNKNVSGLPHSKHTYKSLIYEQTATLWNYVITYWHCSLTIPYTETSQTREKTGNQEKITHVSLPHVQHH